MDPQIQIRIRVYNKMSWIRNTVLDNAKGFPRWGPGWKLIGFYFLTDRRLGPLSNLSTGTTQYWVRTKEIVYGGQTNSLPECFDSTGRSGRKVWTGQEGREWRAVVAVLAAGCCWWLLLIAGASGILAQERLQPRGSIPHNIRVIHLDRKLRFIILSLRNLKCMSSCAEEQEKWILTLLLCYASVCLRSRSRSRSRSELAQKNLSRSASAQKNYVSGSAQKYHKGNGKIFEVHLMSKGTNVLDFRGFVKNQVVLSPRT